MAISLAQYQQAGTKFVKGGGKTYAFRDNTLREIADPQSLGIDINTLPDIGGEDRTPEGIKAAGLPTSFASGGAISSQDLIQSTNALLQDIQTRAAPPV